MQHLLVLVAMSVEKDAIISLFQNYSEIYLGFGLSAKQFSFPTFKVSLLKTGIGLVSAGLATAVAIEKLKIDNILLLEIAGALEPDLEIGEGIFADQVIQHDSVFSGEDGLELMAPACHFVSLNPKDRENPVFNTNFYFERNLSKLRRGILLSGSEFVGSAIRKKQLANLHPGSIAVDMEAAGVALIAKKMQIPFGVVKTIADRLNPDNTISSDYNRFTQKAAENAADIFSRIVNQLA